MLPYGSFLLLLIDYLYFVLFNLVASSLYIKGIILENHIKQEEGEIFPRIGQVWDAGRLAKAGQEMSEMHDEKAGRR